MGVREEYDNVSNNLSFCARSILKGFDFRQSDKLLQSTPTDISRKVVWVVTAIIGSGEIHAIVGILET